jgi:lycopene beta-cyclase
MHRDVDLLILGGGCAGLSLGVALANLPASCPRTLILERRTHYIHDRTWCFWKHANTAYHPLVQHGWEKMRLTLGAETLHVACGDTPYHMLPSHRFYAAAQQTIMASAHVELQLGSAIVSAPQKANGIWQVETEAGTVRATHVIDTRPALLPCVDGATLWQSFAGVEVETTADRFDPTQVELMNFLQPHPDFIAFMYVLPTTPQRALLEMTRFSIHPYAPESLEEALMSEVARHTRGATYSIIHRENGILPMGNRHARPTRDPSFSHVGLYAGAARPSTGYAFQRIQHWASACAAQLATGKSPCGHARDPLLRRAMDHLFLQVIRANPIAAPALFMGLFRHVAPARMIRFLSDRASLRDYFALICALPAGIFLRTIPQALHNRFIQHRRA